MISFLICLQEDFPTPFPTYVPSPCPVPTPPPTPTPWPSPTPLPLPKLKYESVTIDVSSSDYNSEINQILNANYYQLNPEKIKNLFNINILPFSYLFYMK